MCAIFILPVRHGGENHVELIRIPVGDMGGFADEVAKAAVDVNDRFPG